MSFDFIQPLNECVSVKLKFQCSVLVKWYPDMFGNTLCCMELCMGRVVEM